MNNEEKILSMLDNLITSVQQIQTEQQITNQRLANLEQGQANLEQGQTNLEKRQANLETEVQNLSKTVIRLENEHAAKLEALFDGYSLLYDISKDIRKDVVSLISTQGKQDLYIKWLHASKNTL